MPFVTEELWGAGAHEQGLVVSAWPDAGAMPKDKAAAAEMNAVIDLISEIRSVRQTVDLPAGEKFPMLLIKDDSGAGDRLGAYGALVKRLARLETVATIDGASAPKGVALVAGGSTYILDVAGSVDLDVVAARLQKEVGKCEKEVSVIDKKLGNPKFVHKAPAEVVDEQRERRAGYNAQLEKLNASLSCLQS